MTLSCGLGVRESSAAASSGSVLGRLDTTHSPAGLWLFDDGMTDSSGNGLDLTADAGALTYVDYLGKTFAHFDGATRLHEATKDASLSILGDVTISLVVKWQTPPGALSQYLLGKGDAGDAAESTNTNYLVYMSSQLAKYLHEYGVGTNSTIAQISDPSLVELFPSAFLITVVRSGTTVYMYIGPQLMSTTSVLGQTPTGGASAGFFIGGDSDGTDFLDDCLISGAKVTASALTADQVKAEYEKVFGGV